MIWSVVRLQEDVIAMLGSVLPFITNGTGRSTLVGVCGATFVVRFNTWSSCFFPLPNLQTKEKPRLHSNPVLWQAGSLATTTIMHLPERKSDQNPTTFSLNVKKSFGFGLFLLRARALALWSPPSVHPAAVFAFACKRVVREKVDSDL
jgi:hypothetical protein